MSFFRFESTAHPYSFLAKKQVTIGEDILSASSHGPRHWMWHGPGHGGRHPHRGRFSARRRLVGRES